MQDKLCGLLEPLKMWQILEVQATDQTENTVLRRIFGPKREGVAGSWKRLHNEELHNFYASPCIVRVVKSRRLRFAGHVACMKRWKMHMKFWSENLKGRDHLEDLGIGERIILEWILKHMEWKGVDWMELSQDKVQWRALVNAVMKLRVPQKAGDFLTSWATVSFSRRTLFHGVSYI